MAESNERKDAIAYYKKVNKLRELTLSCDFSKDKRMMMPGGSFPYLSAGKIRQQFAPLYSKVGLEIEPSYIDLRELPLVGSKGLQHWAVTLRVRMIDVDTGFAGPACEYIGEGSDVLDKAIRKAMTAAYKSWLSDMFGIEEGIDPEINAAGESVFIPKTDEEKVEIKTKLAEKAIKPPVMPEKPKEAPAPAPKPEIPVKVVAEAHKEEKPKVAAPATPAPKPETPVKPEKPAENADIPEPGCEGGFSAAAPLAKALKGKVQNAQKALKEGKITQEYYDGMLKTYKGISDMTSAMAFNTTYSSLK